MQQGHCRGASDCGGCGADAGGDQKAQDATHANNRESSTKPPLDQPGCQNSFASIANALEYRSPKASIAHGIGSDGGGNDCNDNDRANAPSQCYEDADGNA
jgi:hypothetical protein